MINAAHGPVSTLVLLVTCSRDAGRGQIAVDVAKNLAALIPQAGLSDDFIAFDNNSLFVDHLEHLPAGTKICISDTNIGYWAAIKWVIENRGRLSAKEYSYIYIVESDLRHSSLLPLANSERLLASDRRLSCVRTQEFSVRWRWRYDKRLNFLPFHVTRSEVALRNAVTSEKAWFKKSSIADDLYVSNLHPKLPALNRLTSLAAVFSRLEEVDGFSEHDFFRLMMDEHPLVGVCDGGLFYSMTTWDNRHKFTTGSYSSPEDLKKIGYQASRHSRIGPEYKSLKVRIYKK